jgi:5'-nucleotidase
MKNVLIVDSENLKSKKKIFAAQGKEKIHVLVDFDRTLTKAYVNGKYVPSITSQLRDRHYISEDYSEKAIALANYYHPIEMNLSIPFEERKKKMFEWWSKHFKLLIESGLNKQHLKKIVDGSGIEFRKGALEFIDLLKDNKIPIVIFSSSGVGDTIPLLLEKEHRLYKNVHILTNRYKWDKNGNAIGIINRPLTALNKDETSVKGHPKIYNEIKNRKNVLLLGDSIGDLGMIIGFDYNNIIKIGFLNDKVEESMQEYKKNFDIIITNDSDMNYVDLLMKEIIK